MARTKREPEEILDEEYEQVLERVCAIDVAKEFGQVCVRTPRADGKRTSKVFAVEATTGEILKLGEWLCCIKPSPRSMAVRFPSSRLMDKSRSGSSRSAQVDLS